MSGPFGYNRLHPSAYAPKRLNRVESVAPAPGSNTPDPHSVGQELAASVSHLERAVHEISVMASAVDSLRIKPALSLGALAFSTQPRKIERQGYRYARAFAASACTLSADTPVGIVTVTLPAGSYAYLDAPESSSYTLSAGGVGGVANVFVELVDFRN